MTIISNRQCYNSYFVPFETLAYASWPPTYVTCDCGEYAKHIVHFSRLSCGAPHFQNTFVWECQHCGKRYRQVKGTFNFELVNEREENVDD
ncbi:hypothetical protein [Enterococcus faecium]|uniref:Uncharacterized protein n=1 Tax=Enterococcus faecium TaxID=1352 RepID=A0A242AZY8_ENTFC|nr:hypothetical protein [Enterococcus faecium]OTN86629.1 hypothetical protein A5810_003027 [Enterococcus faecium]